MIKTAPRIALFPLTAEVNHQGRLVVGGCDTVELTKQFGTPLYLFDEIGLRRKCAEYKTEFSRRYPDSMVLYAAKAFINKAMALLIKEVGLGLDVVSGGEMGIAHSVDFPLGKAYFHDNNKSAEELSLALEYLRCITCWLHSEYLYFPCFSGCQFSSAMN